MPIRSVRPVSYTVVSLHKPANEPQPEELSNSRHTFVAGRPVSSAESPVQEVEMHEVGGPVDAETAEAPNPAIESVSESEETTSSADEADDENNEDSSSEECYDDGQSEEDDSDEDDSDEDDSDEDDSDDDSYNLISSIQMCDMALPAEFGMVIGQYYTFQDLYLVLIRKLAHHFPGSYREPFTLENTLGTLSAEHLGQYGDISWLGEWNVDLDGVPLNTDFSEFVTGRMKDYLCHTGAERPWFSLEVKVPLVERAEERPILAEVNWT